MSDLYVDPTLNLRAETNPCPHRNMNLEPDIAQGYQISSFRDREFCLVVCLAMVWKDMYQNQQGTYMCDEHKISSKETFAISCTSSLELVGEEGNEDVHGARCIKWLAMCISSCYPGANSCVQSSSWGSW